MPPQYRLLPQSSLTAHSFQPVLTPGKLTAACIHSWGVGGHVRRVLGFGYCPWDLELIFLVHSSPAHGPTLILSFNRPNYYSDTHISNINVHLQSSTTGPAVTANSRSKAGAGAGAAAGVQARITKKEDPCHV